MALTTSNITGRIPLPNNSVAGSVEVVFTLNTYDTEGLDTIPPQSTVSFALTANGEFPTGAKLWQNVRGLRGTSYAVTVRWSEMVAGKPVVKVGALGHVQVGDAESYSLADLVAAPASGDIGWYVNVPQATWVDFNDRLDYMYSIAESSLPATVERAVEAELAAKASEQAAAASAQAAAGSAVQAVEDVEDVRDAALSDVGTARSDALSDVGTARSDALTAIGTAESASVTAVETAVETARDDALDLINPKVQEANAAAQTATTKAGEASVSALAAEDARNLAVAVTEKTKGGTTGQLLQKASSDDYDYQWMTPASAGDMLKATYDPANKNSDAFSMANMVEGANAKIMTSAERTKLSDAVQKANDTGLGGFAVIGKSLGNLSGSLTPTYVGGNYQAGTITGALTINAPTASGVYDLKIELLIGAGAGAVTLVGFDNTDFGEAFTTTEGDFFTLQIEKGATQTIATVRKPS